MRLWFKILAWVGGVVGAVLGVLYLTLFDVWTVPTDDPLEAASILPTLSAGDVVVVTRHYAGVSRGDLLRCPDPQAPGRFVIARAIAQFGDHLDLSNEVVSIDRNRTPSPMACDPPTMVVHDPRTDEDLTLRCSMEEYASNTYGALRSDNHPEPPTSLTMESGRWFLVSDDRHVHLDSRDFGQVDASACQHVVFRIVSAAGFGDSKNRLTLIW